MRRLLVLLVFGAVALGVGVTAAHGEAARPQTVWKPIPFGAERKSQMAAYSKRHYGQAEWRLRNPKVIVEHFTASNSFSSAYWTFAGNAPDSELHELPGVCAHFVIDRDGTIYQLVPLTVRCRHTVGLNHRAIGIEHVGTSDAQVLGNTAQMKASLRLTAYLMNRFEISVGNVIGHNESVQSTYFREHYRAWQCRTHGDFRRASMRAYRARLKPLARRAGLDLTPPRWVDRGC
ncbi:MAG: peptidoglycan recognition family protein [Gaiellales bacterium]